MCRKNEEKQTEFLVKLENVIKAYEKADELFEEFDSLCDSYPSMISEVDTKRSDLLHRYTNGSALTDEQHLLLSKCLQKLEEDRRSIKNIEFITVVWDKHKNKITNKANRPFLRQAVSTALKNLNTDYKPRIYSYDVINDMINPKTSEINNQVDKKPTRVGKGRTAGSKNMTDELRRQIKEELNTGKSARTVAKICNVCVATVYNVRGKSEQLQDSQN